MRWLILSVCAFWAAGTATAQQLPATDVEPPRYDGAVVKIYMTRLVAKVRDLAVEERIPADSLSEEVVLALRLDTLGQVVERRFWTMPAPERTAARSIRRRPPRGGLF